MGMVLTKNQKYGEAQSYLNTAIQMQPKNPQAHFLKASVHFEQEQYHDALMEYREVMESAPREPAVFIMMGKVCKKMKDKDAAMLHFSTALDLHPKDNNEVKLLIDRLHEDDRDVDDEDGPY